MLGRRIKRLLEERGIKQIVVAADLKISEAQVTRILNDRTDMRVGQLEYFADLLNIPAWALLGNRKSFAVELLQATREFVDRVLPMVEPVRSREISEARADARLVTLLRVAATADNETYEDDPEPRRYEVPAEFYRPRVAGFQVVGDSMSGDGIVSGDVVFTRPTSEEEAHGEICVCRVNGYRHLKRVFYREGKIELVSSAPKRRSWKLEAESHEFEVLGIVIGRTGRVAR